MSSHPYVIEIAVMQQSERIPINLLRITGDSEEGTHGSTELEKDVQSLSNVCSFLSPFCFVIFFTTSDYS
jgi:hypothetical protein